MAIEGWRLLKADITWIEVSTVALGSYCPLALVKLLFMISTLGFS